MENAKCYAPQILVGTEGLPREQWLEYRRKGIGGSDAAAVLGISPFRTGRDLYYDKLNIVTADDAENWVQLEVGTLLEPLVAKIFAHKTGYKIYRRPFMFQHPLYPWMLADLDYMVELPDGTTAILEIKTTNYNAKDNWWYNGEEIVPIYYESQGRHYMAVMNIDRVYFCCLYGNSEDEAMIRRIDRDMAYEEELIALERDFWENHVLTKTPPPYVEADGDLILESLRRKLGPADKDAPPVLLGQPQFGQLSMLLSLQEQKKTLSADVNKLEKDIKRLKGIEQDSPRCQWRRSRRANLVSPHGARLQGSHRASCAAACRIRGEGSLRHNGHWSDSRNAESCRPAGNSCVRPAASEWVAVP